MRKIFFRGFSFLQFFVILIVYLPTISNATITQASPSNSSKMVKVTAVLDKILHSERYDRNLRPGLDIVVNNTTGKREVIINEPVLVAINLLVKNLGPINEDEMMYAMEIYFRQQWRDDRLQFNASYVEHDEIKVSVNILKRLWRPDTLFLNGKGSKLHVITTPNKLLRIHADGTVFYSMRLTVQAICHMNFQKYPVDTQTCPLQIGSFAYNSENVNYLWWTDMEKQMGHNGTGGYNFKTENTVMSQFLFRKANSRYDSVKIASEFRDALRVDIVLERMIGYYLLQIYLPSYMTVSMSWVSFWINREATPARVTLGSTTLLTSVTITLTGRMGLPKVSYATALDIFLLICFFFVFSALLEYAGVNYFTKTGNIEIPKKHNQSAATNIGATTTTNSASTIPFVRRNGQLMSSQMTSMESEDIQEERRHNRDACPTMFLNCIKGNRKYMLMKEQLDSTPQPNSESQIDKVSRICFPASFIIFNVIYWLVLSDGSNLYLSPPEDGAHD